MTSWSASSFWERRAHTSLQLAQHMSSSPLGQLDHLLPMGKGAEPQLLAGRATTWAGGKWLFPSTTWYLMCGWQDNDAPHTTDSPNSTLPEHSIYECMRWYICTGLAQKKPVEIHLAISTWFRPWLCCSGWGLNVPKTIRLLEQYRCCEHRVR